MKNRSCRRSHIGEKLARIRHWAPINRPANPVTHRFMGFPILFAGRLAVISAILAFMTSYAYGIYQYGWWLGVAVGWLPSAALTWLIAQVLGWGIRYFVSEPASDWAYKSGIRYASAPFYCSDKVNTALKYRRQDK
jgi:hypothetical protein